jgi:tripartite-type tricarboxylate transporter receptor subunit TctC
MRRKAVHVLVLSVVFGLFTMPVIGSDYPAKPLEIVCPWTAGSSTDLSARIIAEVGSKYFGQPVVVVNKPGAAGSIAAADVITSSPEGYKALWGSHAFFSMTMMTQKVPFKPDDLVPLANFLELRQGLVVRSDSPFKTFDDLVAYAKKHQGQLKWSHSGRGLVLHLMPLMIFKKAGITTIDVPYKGTPEAFAALLGGHVDAASLSYASIVDMVKSGKLRFLMLYSEKRFKEQPNVPTAVELGFGEATLPTYFGLYIHKDTPESIQKALGVTAKKIYDDPAFKKGIERVGDEPRYGGPDFLREAIKKQEKMATPMLKELGLYQVK